MNTIIDTAWFAMVEDPVEVEDHQDVAAGYAPCAKDRRARRRIGQLHRNGGNAVRVRRAARREGNHVVDDDRNGQQRENPEDDAHG
jgi:hypothetical protein